MISVVLRLVKGLAKSLLSKLATAVRDLLVYLEANHEQLASDTLRGRRCIHHRHRIHRGYLSNQSQRGIGPAPQSTGSGEKGKTSREMQRTENGWIEVLRCRQQREIGSWTTRETCKKLKNRRCSTNSALFRGWRDTFQRRKIASTFKRSLD